MACDFQKLSEGISFIFLDSVRLESYSQELEGSTHSVQWSHGGILDEEATRAQNCFNKSYTYKIVVDVLNHHSIYALLYLCCPLLTY